MTVRPRILVVDDEEDLRTSVADVLRILMDADVEEYASGETAIEAHRRSPADMVVIDYRMPVMNGLEAMEVLRHITPGLGVILFTAYQDANIVDRARQQKVDFILPKPAQAEELVAVVRALLARLANGEEAVEPKARSGA